MPPKTPNPNDTEHERKEKKKFNFFSKIGYHRYFLCPLFFLLHV
jgi:hypothetical protein